MELDGVWKVAQIGDHADFDTLGAKREANRVDGVVWNREAVDLDVADCKARACLKQIKPWRRVFPLDSRRRQTGHVDGGPDLSRKARQAGDVIAVLMRNHHRVDPVRPLADRRQPLFELAKAQAGVHQNAGSFRSDDRAVAGTAARQNAELDDGGVLSEAVLT